MTHASIATLVAVLALAIAVAAMSLAATITRRVGIRDPIAVPKFWRRVLRIRPVPPAAEGFVQVRDGHQRVAFIANPTKPGMAEVREQALRACSIRYLPQPLWLYTTEDDPGTGQARKAIEGGADLVVAVGGDGTVRAVAEALAGTDIKLGIVPMGTGNLFARNLDLPLGDVPSLLRTVLEGAEEKIDVGWLELERREPKAAEAKTGEIRIVEASDSGAIDPAPSEGGVRKETHLFLVMAGAGIDAEMVAGADDRLKRRFGWLAYLVAIVQHLGSRRMRAWISIDGSEPVEGQMRTVLMANVGSLPGGFTLIPDASVTDGLLDIATLDARAGLVGWTELFGTVIAQGAGLRQPEILKAYRASRIDHTRGKEFKIRMEQSQKVQVDGELLGRASRISARVDAGALTVRVPQRALPN